MAVLKKFGVGKFKASDTSKEFAKKRLQILLVHDAADLSPKFLSMMQEELKQVILKYVDIPDDGFSFELTQSRADDGSRVVPALVASIPIKNIKRDSLNKLDSEPK